MHVRTHTYTHIHTHSHTFTHTQIIPQSIQSFFLPGGWFHSTLMLTVLDMFVKDTLIQSLLWHYSYSVMALAPFFWGGFDPWTLSFRHQWARGLRAKLIRQLKSAQWMTCHVCTITSTHPSRAHTPLWGDAACCHHLYIPYTPYLLYTLYILYILNGLKNKELYVFLKSFNGSRWAASLCLNSMSGTRLNMFLTYFCTGYIQRSLEHVRNMLAHRYAHLGSAVWT